jgi:hypothetical protein
MKKKNLKIFTISFALVYVMIASLSIINKQPLIFVPVYDFQQFFYLFILLGLLSLGLILVLDSLEKIFKKYLTQILTTPLLIYAYFILVSTFGLFIFTLIAGYVEWKYTFPVFVWHFATRFSPFYYYSCVSNSCIYLIAGYTITLATAVYFSNRLIKSSMANANT